MAGAWWRESDYELFHRLTHEGKVKSARIAELEAALATRDARITLLERELSHLIDAAESASRAAGKVSK